MKLLALALLVPALAAAETCVLTDRTVTQASAAIVERSGLRQEIVNLPSGIKRCQVSFRARIGSEWHTAFGSFDWPGDRPVTEACGAAVARADSAVIERAGRTLATSEKVMVCRDQPDFNLIKSTVPGTVGRLHQFRPHPQYPNRFWHNGAQCRWFLDSAFRNNDVRTYQGIICEIQPDQWAVVDKF